MVLRARTCLPLAILAGLLLAGPSVGARRCDASPDRPVAVPGPAVLLGDVEVSLVAERYARTTPSDLELRLDLLVRPVHPVTGRPRVGAYVPHLAADYVLTDSRARSTVAGKLDFRLSRRGFSYGTTIALDVAGGETLDLAVTLYDRSVLVERPRCPRFPLRLRFAVDLAATPLRIES